MLFLFTFSHRSYAMEEGASLAHSAITETAAQEARLHTDAILAKHGAQRLSENETLERKARYHRSSLRMLEGLGEAQFQSIDASAIVPPLKFDTKALESASQKLELLQGIANPMLTDRSQTEQSSAQSTPRPKESIDTPRDTPRSSNLEFILTAASPVALVEANALAKKYRILRRTIKEANRYIQGIEKELKVLQDFEAHTATASKDVRLLGKKFAKAERRLLEPELYSALHFIHGYHEQQEDILKQLKEQYPNVTIL